MFKLVLVVIILFLLLIIEALLMGLHELKEINKNTHERYKASHERNKQYDLSCTWYCQ